MMMLDYFFLFAALLMSFGGNALSQMVDEFQSHKYVDSRSHIIFQWFA